MSDSNSVPEESLFRGMPLNEALCIAGLSDQFDRAAVRRDRAAMISLLRQVDLPETAAAETTDTILALPHRYGY
jgi:hypothetical protein